MTFSHCGSRLLRAVGLILVVESCAHALNLTPTSVTRPNSGCTTYNYTFWSPLCSAPSLTINGTTPSGGAYSFSVTSWSGWCGSWSAPFSSSLCSTAELGSYGFSSPGDGVTATLSVIATPKPVVSAGSGSGKVGVFFSDQIWATNNPTSYSGTGLPPGLSVNFSNGSISGTPTTQGSFSGTISATNATGTGSAPYNAIIIAPADITPPSIPTGLTATRDATSPMSQINLAWNASTDTGGSGMGGYQITCTTGCGYSLIATTVNTNYRMTGLSSGTSYTFTVQAYDKVGNLSAASAPASASTQSQPPLAITGIAPASPAPVPYGNRTVTLAFTTNYSASCSVTTVGPVPGSTTFIWPIPYNLPPNASATFHISCSNVKNVNDTAAADWVIITPPDTTAPGVPTGLTAARDTANPHSQINLSWTASSDDAGGSGLAGYKLYRGGSPLATLTATSYSDTGLAAGTAYSYTVSAYDNASPANASAQSAAVSTSTLVAQFTISNITQFPANPVQPYLDPTAGSVTLSLTTNRNASCTINGNPFDTTGGITSHSTTVVYDIAPNSSADYTLACTDGSGTAHGSAGQTYTIQTGADTKAPSIPGSLTVTPISRSQINLSWPASSDNVGVAGYTIYRNGAFLATTTNTSYSDTGLSAGTAYSYAVGAYDAVGNGSASQGPVTGTTPVVIPGPPSLRTLTIVSPSEIDLSWTAANPGTYPLQTYAVYRCLVGGCSTLSQYTSIANVPASQM